MIELSLQRYAFLALAAAVLFGASTPLAKILLEETAPVVLAGLLYLGSGIGLALVRLAQGRSGHPHEASLTARDWGWLAGAILAGGITAPVLLLWGLSRSGAAETSLLLNFEGVMTALAAALLFREAIGARVWIAALVMLAGGIALGYDPASSLVFSPYSLAIAGACLCWALDNNLTRKVAGADPLVTAMTKGLLAGSFNLALGLLLEETFPGPQAVAGALALGFLAYGVSLVLFIYAMRHLGAARTAAHFSTAPFIGAVLAVPLLGEPVTAALVTAAILMAIATWLVLTERHEHDHEHERTAHSHRHVHDEHHQHAHRGDEGPEPHVHEHVHEPLRHAHPHLPDLHHQHKH
ncbi:MAG TPA: EamA family transporter [Burkholderiales bacterium]|nr:EamA family transporter [Burkholderiales bacterium]